MNRDMTEFYRIRDEDYRIYDLSEVSIFIYNPVGCSVFFFERGGPGEWNIMEKERTRPALPYDYTGADTGGGRRDIRTPLTD